ncbi:MAG: DUF3299 domain-containing protein [Phycisphaerales bacterium]|nr:DUF3299 domain-containing protein [Phycisphaerales bacterium]
MKTFWVVIVVVVGLAAGAFLLRGGRAPKPIPVGEPTRIVMGDQKPVTEAGPGPVEYRPAPAEPAKVEPATSQPLQPPAAPKVEPPAVQTSEPLIPPAPVEQSKTTKPAETKPVDIKPVETKPAESKPVETKPFDVGPAEIKPPETRPVQPEPVPPPVEDVKPVEASPAPAPAPPALQTPEPLIPPAPVEVKSESPPVAAPAPAPAPAAKPTDAAPPSDGPPVIEKREDGSMLVDGKYEVKGDGSAEKPYEVTWEMLISAQETYQPKEGKKLIPGRLAMLDNKHVRVTGYIAFPLYVQEAREMLSMLNQWDGCCIGVPPTPYDAIEVRLKDAVTGPERFATFGTVEGRFGVKPYVVGDWLVGLYTMDDAKFNAKVFTGS